MKDALPVRGKEIMRSHPDGWCLITLDLEHFRLFNEWYGRDAGDQLLARIGKRLLQIETDTDGLTCYLGQDDFVILFPYEEDSVQRLFDDVHRYVMEYGTSVGFMPAIGVCMADDTISIEEMFDRALQASQHAKEDYHHRIRIFEESMFQKTEQDYQIKLDAKFLRMNSDDRRGVQILESIVGMAKSMEAPIIVEGVETEEETEFIKTLGCRYVQGYHFYRPMPVADFEALIADDGNIDTGGFTL